MALELVMLACALFLDRGLFIITLRTRRTGLATGGGWVLMTWARGQRPSVTRSQISSTRGRSRNHDRGWLQRGLQVDAETLGSAWVICSQGANREIINNTRVLCWVMRWDVLPLFPFLRDSVSVLAGPSPLILCPLRGPSLLVRPSRAHALTLPVGLSSSSHH